MIAVGGMSDVAGHGNYFEEAYPNVCGDALRPVFEAAGVRFQVRNMAMGGVPSFPNSVCMADNFGGDADVVVWDFRMVERDVHKGELFIRQALLMPRAPFVMYKRYQSYLRKDLKYAWGPAGAARRRRDGGLQQAEEAVAALQNDRFCAKDPCPCRSGPLARRLQAAAVPRAPACKSSFGAPSNWTHLHDGLEDDASTLSVDNTG